MYNLLILAKTLFCKNVDFKKLKTGIIINNYDNCLKRFKNLLNDDKLINFYSKKYSRLKKIKKP